MRAARATVIQTACYSTETMKQDNDSGVLENNAVTTESLRVRASTSQEQNPSSCTRDSRQSSDPPMSWPIASKRAIKLEVQVAALPKAAIAIEKMAAASRSTQRWQKKYSQSINLSRWYLFSPCKTQTRALPLVHVPVPAWCYLQTEKWSTGLTQLPDIFQVPSEFLSASSPFDLPKPSAGVFDCHSTFPVSSHPFADTLPLYEDDPSADYDNAHISYT